LLQYMNVTDGQKDRHTQHDGIGCMRGNEIIIIILITIIPDFNHQDLCTPWS